MDDSTFLVRIESLVENQGGEEYVALVLDEFGLTYVDEVVEHREYFLGRCTALWEEAH